jgi:hypothetical protein
VLSTSFTCTLSHLQLTRALPRTVKATLRHVQSRGRVLSQSIRIILTLICLTLKLLAQCLTAMISTPNAAGIVVVAVALAALCYSKNLSPRSLTKLLRQKAALVAGRGLPDFAQLTGFPHPKPVHDFNIACARPRPYRPFRWEYHQNMCMWAVSISRLSNILL